MFGGCGVFKLLILTQGPNDVSGYALNTAGGGTSQFDRIHTVWRANFRENKKKKNLEQLYKAAMMTKNRVWSLSFVVHYECLR